jgi:hypothetical protein
VTKPLPKKWSIWTAAKLGVVLGTAVTGYNWLLGSVDSVPGFAFGAIIGSVFWCCVVASLRNVLIFGWRKNAR